MLTKNRIFLLSMLLSAMIIGAPVEGAVVLNGSSQGSGPTELASPYGVSVDRLGNFYVVDQQRHQVLEFDENGVPKRIFGTYGFGDGQLYYPQGVTVGVHNSGETLVYVADTSNSRISVFDDKGHFIDTVGEFGSGDAQLDNPGGIAFIKYSFASGGNLLVADTRNHRVGIFDDDGGFLTNFICSTCPSGGIRPVGVAARWTGSGQTLEIYAVDELTKVVRVMNYKGEYLRTVGEQGTGEGQLQEPDDVAVDEEGNVYVTDTGFAGGSTERVTKFDPDGKFVYSFGTSGSTPFTQPHGIALDQQGLIYVANTGGETPTVYRFKEEAPKLFAAPYAARDYWIDTKGAWFSFWYNGVEQTCRGKAEARFHVPLPGGARDFAADVGPLTVAGFDSKTKIDLSTKQTGWLERAWTKNQQVSVKVDFTARCQDGKLLKKSINFNM